MRVSSTGGTDQAGAAVARMNPPCNPGGLAFGPDGRLYLTGFGANGDEIGVVRPNAANPPFATGFATGTPGANGVAFDEDGNLYVSDGGTGQGRVFRVGPSGGAATVLPTRRARGALWRVELGNRGTLRTRTGCDTTFPQDTLCLEALFVQHLALEGADGIALDRNGNVWVDANERNAIAVVDRRGEVSEFFRNPVVAGRRNARPLEFPTSPVLAGRTLCTTSSDLNRRDNVENTAGEAAPGTAIVGKVSCLDQRLDDAGLELPVDD